jgi:putative oxidoreductase
MLDEGFFAAWTPRVLSILRIMAGLLLLQYGTAKILGFPAWEYAQGIETFSLTWFAGIIELVGGALLTLGLFTRPVAFILSGEMAFAYFLGHASSSFFPILNMGTEAVLFCFVYLYLAVAGGGPWSLDAAMRRT